jgi:hypothetical protein
MFGGLTLPWSKDRTDSSSSNSSGKPQPPPSPVAAVPERLVDEATLRSYEASADAVGYSTSGLLRMQIVDFLASNNIPVFDFDATYRWLSHYPRKRKEKEFWGWKLLRDTKDRSEWYYSYSPWGYTSDGYGTNRSNRFQSLLPLPVLEVVASLSEKFGELIEFYVSDRGVPNDRHFIMLLIRDGGYPNSQNCFIFDSWVGGSEDITSRGVQSGQSAQ